MTIEKQFPNSDIWATVHYDSNIESSEMFINIRDKKTKESKVYKLVE